MPKNSIAYIFTVSFLILLLTGYPHPAYALGFGLFDNFGKWIGQLFKHGDTADDFIPHSTHITTKQADGITPDQMYAQYMSLKTSQPEEANMWLFKAAYLGSKKAAQELDNLCSLTIDNEIRKQCEERGRPLTGSKQPEGIKSDFRWQMRQ